MSIAMDAVAFDAGAAIGSAGYGGFTVGTMQLALPMSALREVLPCQGLLNLPCPAACVVGGIDLRGVIVPVVDLQILLGRPPLVASQPCVIIVVHGARLLGLLAEGITGVFSAKGGARREPQAQQPGEALFVGSLRRDDTAGMVSLLAPEVLLRLPHVPTIDDPEPERELTSTERTEAVVQSAAMPVILLRCGTLALALDALSVHATISEVTLRPSVVAIGDCKGVMAYSGERIPAVDLLSLCGLGHLRDPARAQAFVMRLPQGYVALLVDEVMDVITIEREDVVPVPAFALPRPALFAGALPASVLPAEVRSRRGITVAQYLLLDGPAMRACQELSALSEVSVPDTDEPAQGKLAPVGRGNGGGASGAGGPSGRREMITYELFGEEATPIEQVAEILAYDPQIADYEPRGALVGLMVSRGRSIPVMCLRRMAGLAPVALDETSSVLVVKSADDWVGFAVPRLLAIESARWSPELPPGGMGQQDALALALQSRELALVDSGGTERMLRVLDLALIAQQLRESAVAA